MLIIFGGLPGTGKTTISKEVARRLKAVYLRVDTIEQTIKNLEGYPDSLIIGSEGYVISYAIAKENLSLGIDVIADSVNPIAITRHDWRQVAKEANTGFIEIELICSDKIKHQDRIEERVADIGGHKLPTWKDVLNRDYEPWESISMVVDTSRHTVNESVQKIIEHIKLEPKSVNTTVFSNKTEFYEQNFSSLSHPSTIIEDKVFEGCRFISANFSESQFIRCKFIDCEFNNCNLSAVQFKASLFNNVTFFESKVTGVNWTMLNWSQIRLSSPFQFYNSILSHSSFYGLELQELVIEACIAHDVDFREADLRRANFKLTDLEKSQFVHTKLNAADFTEAHSYSIDPTENDIRKAKFSLPDAIHLLDGFDIQIS